METEQVAGSKVGITAVVMTAALMAMIDITIVNVALNDIRASFGTPIDQIGWVSTGYMMANIVIIPMTGWTGAFCSVAKPPSAIWSPRPSCSCA